MAGDKEITSIDFYAHPELAFAGEHMKLHHEGDRSVISFEETNSGRRCGSCTLCCKLLPIPRPPLHKPAGVRCQHQRHTGCAIYAKRPIACRTWACRWLIDDETAGMKRPDRSHVVIDMTDDYVTLRQDDGLEWKVGVIQIWCDPAHPQAYKAPEVRAYMLMQAEKYRAATIVRYNSRDAVVVFPPPLCDDGQWHERADDVAIVNRTPLDSQVDADLQAYEARIETREQGGIDGGQRRSGAASASERIGGGRAEARRAS